MGGQNHQPCNKYLLNSTKLSRAISVARIEMERANIVLEDVIISELKRGTSDLRPMKSCLTDSQKYTERASGYCDRLRTQMDNEGYVDLPPYRWLDLEERGKLLAETGMIDIDAWNDILEWGASSGFYGVLDELQNSLNELANLTKELNEAVEVLCERADTGEVEIALETNSHGNVKREFARLYTKWHWFGSRFLTSSILSTEVWYEANRYPSLLDQQVKQIKVA